VTTRTALFIKTMPYDEDQEFGAEYEQWLDDQPGFYDAPDADEQLVYEYDRDMKLLAGGLI
jgi:hypothetical protein